MTDIIKNIESSEESERPDSYWKYVKRQFKKNKRALVAIYMVFAFLLVAVFADFLANEKPISCTINGETHYPIFKSYLIEIGIVDKWPENLLNADWKNLNYESVNWAWVPYSPETIDVFNSQYANPFEDQLVDDDKWHHKLGTDEIGRDVMAGLIHGTRTAFLVGTISMGIATMIGLFLGALAGYFGDGRVKVHRVQLYFGFFGAIIGYFYAFYVRSNALIEALSSGFVSSLFQIIISMLIFLFFIIFFYFLGKPLSGIKGLSTRVGVPMDTIVTRLIEITVSVPRIILIISFTVVIEKPSLFHTMLIIGLTSWTGIARFTRAEMMKVGKMEYMEAAKAFGFGHLRAIFKHALPNSLSPVFIAIAFGIASSVLIESTLSFLGIGVPAEMVTWGSLLMEGKRAMDCWWLIVCPGIAIFMMVTLFNLIGEGLTDALDPRQKK